MILLRALIPLPSNPNVRCAWALTFPPGARLGHYEIKSQIGAGGKGEVYLAQDIKLDRKVALKILPAELAANQDRMRRFVQEANATAALNHPNIAHIYEIGESNGTNFIAMEFVDGKTLREQIHGEKSELKVVLKHLLQVADGLAKAHVSGIAHRDLKTGPSYGVALAHIGLNDKEEALVWLEKEVAERGYWAGVYAVAPELDDLRSDQVFKEMLKRLHLPE